MTKYAWASDIHLDFLRNDEQKIVKFTESLVKDNPTGIILTGDISTAKQLTYHLSIMERVAQRPIYFVLGNHDYYYGSIDEVRKNMHELSNISPFLKHLSTTPYVQLTPSTALVGCDGWYDCQHGDWKNSTFSMSDWQIIHDFLQVSGGNTGMYGGGGFNKGAIVSLARKLAHQSVQHIHDGIKAAAKYATSIIVATHVPPFKEAHVYNGRTADDNAQPWYTNKLLGDMLLDAAKAYPKIRFTCVAGHTHGRVKWQASSNLYCYVAGANYGKPALEQLIEVS